MQSLNESCEAAAREAAQNGYGQQNGKRDGQAEGGYAEEKLLVAIVRDRFKVKSEENLQVDYQSYLVKASLVRKRLMKA